MSQSSISPQHPNRTRSGSFILLILALICLLMTTYSGRAASIDTVRIMDAISSYANFGDMSLDESLWQDPPQYIAGDKPFQWYEPNESLIVFAGVPFYWLGELLPHVGLVHTTRLLGIVTIALCGGLVYAIGLALGYRRQTALWMAILAVLATGLWPYSKTLFRAPLVAFWLLLATYSLIHWQRAYRRVFWLLLAALALTAAVLTKNSAVVAIPALLVLGLPQRVIASSLSRWITRLLMFGWVLLLAMALVPPVADGLLTLLAVFLPSLDVRFVRDALYAYLLSPGGSLWGSSPLLLLALPGGWWMLRNGQQRLVWMVAILVAGYALGHALLTDIHWFGGLSWPPRFLIPVVPLVALLILPVLERFAALAHWRWLIVVLVVYSIAIQIIASISWQDAYINLLPDAAGGLAEWLPGMTDPRYWRWFLLPQSWPSLSFDVAWVRSGQQGFIVAFAAAGSACLVLLMRAWHPAVSALIASALSVVLLVTGLQALYRHDPLFHAQRDQLHAVRELLLAEAGDSDVLLLAGNADTTYEDFIANTLSSNTIRPVVLGFQPGERTSPADTPRIVSDYPPELLDLAIPRVIDHLANTHDRIWWLAHNSLFLDWSVRPEERYLSANYYLLREITTPVPDVRLLAFSTVQAPSRYALRLPEQTTTLRFGDHIRLTGVTLPQGTRYQAGDVVPITFFWQSDSALDQNVTIAWFIANADNPTLRVQGVDSMPDANFRPTVSWAADELIYDNRAIQLPHDWPSGTYEVWLRLYPTGTDGSGALPITAGATAIADDIGLLPLRITIDS